MRIRNSTGSAIVLLVVAAIHLYSSDSEAGNFTTLAAVVVVSFLTGYWVLQERRLGFGRSRFPYMALVLVWLGMVSIILMPVFSYLATQ